MTTAEALEAAREAAEEGLRNAVSRDEHIRWGTVLARLAAAEDAGPDPVRSHV